MTGGAIVVAVIAIFLVVFASRRGLMSRMAKVMLVVAIAILGLTCVILFTLKLETVYYTHHVEYRFASVYGTDFAKVSLDSVTDARVLTYNPTDYGGWGAKGNENTLAVNASGNKGILFTFKSGRKLLIGTQQPDTLYARLKGYYPF